ncbi:MAG: sigma-70 family RNA polymerase sigma factor [Oscillospiraceae bacterium]|nr:sigma-70 family RNA polymerase sigma factor [Oscillospiraceae bacterium]
MTPEHEKHCIERVLKGDANAFEHLVHAYEKTVYNLALRTLGNREDAEDVTQEAFLKAYRSLDSFRGDSKFSVWLYRIVSNLCLDLLRSRQRKPTQSLTVEDDDGEIGELEISDEHFSPEKLLDRKLTRESVQRGLSALPDDSRQILLLRELQGMSYEEIGQALDLEPGTVKSRIFRARKRLCAFLLQDGNLPDSLASKYSGGGDRP